MTPPRKHKSYGFLTADEIKRMGEVSPQEREYIIRDALKREKEAKKKRGRK